jgi:non-canonical poly(A) RNA polymerase PAPD5/7
MDEDFISFLEEDIQQGQRGNNIPPALLTAARPQWLTVNSINSRANPLVRLHNEILDFCANITPSKAELTTRERVLQELSGIIHSIWPQSRICLFGSQMTKILTPTSDIDVAILDVPVSESNGPDAVDQLLVLHNKIQELDIASYLEIISNAKVPIIKLDHKVSGISVDICVNNSSGLATGKIIKKLLREFPPLKPLTLVLKVFLVSTNYLTVIIVFSRYIAAFVQPCFSNRFAALCASHLFLEYLSAILYTSMPL